MRTFIFIIIISILSYFYYLQKNAPVVTDSEIPLDCVSWTDGCNTCFAENGKIFGCSQYICETKETPSCAKYKEE